MALLASLSGATAVGGLCYLCPHLPVRLYHKLFFGEDYVGPDVQFERRMAGGGRTATGQRFSFSRFSSSDCIDVDFQTERYDSDEDAKKRMSDLIRSSSEVVERSEKLYLNGTRAGPRAVLLFNEYSPKAIIVWTAENRVVSLGSTSLSHALEFEKRYHNRVSPAPDWGHVLKEKSETSKEHVE